MFNCQHNLWSKNCIYLQNIKIYHRTIYYGNTDGRFKQRYGNHNKSFSYINYPPGLPEEIITQTTIERTMRRNGYNSKDGHWDLSTTKNFNSQEEQESLNHWQNACKESTIKGSHGSVSTKT